MSGPHPAPLLEASVRVDHVPPEGREIEVRATEAQRRAIAEQLKISAVDRLEAKLALTRFRGGLRVLGRIEAVTEQPCVITFVPVRQQIDEDFDRVFLPIADRPAGPAPEAELFIEADSDEPDYFEGHEVDLSDAIVESVALALDPYPRAEGASLDDAALPEDDAGISPFAGLKTLFDPDDKR